MINLFVKGTCPRRLLNYSLPRALLSPNVSANSLKPDELIYVTTTSGVFELGLEAIEEHVMKSQSNAIVAIFEDFDKSVCHDMFLLRPTFGGVHRISVYPFQDLNWDRMILVSACASEAFAFEGNGQIYNVPPPRQSASNRAAERGWRELKRRMKAIAKDGRPWSSAHWGSHFIVTH